MKRLELELVGVDFLLRLRLTLGILLVVGTFLVVLIVVFRVLVVVRLDTPAVLLQDRGPRVELVDPRRRAFRAADHHRGGINQNPDFPRELTRVERALSFSAAARCLVDQKDGLRDGLLLALGVGVELREVRARAHVVLAGEYVNDYESLVAFLAPPARLVEVSPVLVDVRDDPVRHAPARERERPCGGAEGSLVRRDRVRPDLSAERRVERRS